MEKIIDIADYRILVYIVYFKKDFTLSVESRKRGISFKKNTPYLLYRGDPAKYYIGKLKIDKNSSKETLNCNGKAYTIMDFEINSIIPYVDAIFPEHLEGNINKNLLINTYVLTKVGSKEVPDVVSDIDKYIISLEKGKGYIKLSLFFSRGTYLSINIRDLTIGMIDDYSIGMYNGSPVYLSIDDDYLDEKSLTKILYSLYDNYKFKDDFNVGERRIRSSLSSYDYEKGIPYAISRESQYKLVTSKISIKPRKYNIRYDYSSTKEISSFDTNTLLNHADAVFPNLLTGTLDNNILLNTFVFYGHKEQDIESLLSNLHEYIVSYNIPESGRINLSMYLKKGTFMSLNVRDSRINLLGNYKVDYLDGIRLDGDYIDIDIFTKLLYSFYSQYGIKQGYDYKVK